MNMSIVAPAEHPEHWPANISQMSGQKLITIFTATYNRAHTLHRAFESLRAQTFRDFEWLVVDDGSIDGTNELVAGWMETADFPIRYLRQNHSGKHFAHNLALSEARGLLFTVLDSDDALPSDALGKLKQCWISFPESDGVRFILWADFAAIKTVRLSVTNFRPIRMTRICAK